MDDINDTPDDKSKKRGSYHRRDVHGIRPRKRKAVSQVGMNEINDHCNTRLRESGAAINYTEEMHIKAMIRGMRAERLKEGGGGHDDFIQKQDTQSQ